ncbi:MAG: hypothetical protein GT601_16860 [Acidaminobacter sp.]|uniref:hypothetical protein n=1 Tax=Acidaminobacter sp. TaxID=1872102 RepID=UPI00137FC0DA|nr:hypothetical protein [Acidaminobacter sp.]MZQ99338.1 hypothetical protein [Acidaminobacter sp.]
MVEYLSQIKGDSMKRIIAIVLLSLLVLCAVAQADCIRDQYGNTVCGPGECVTDIYRAKVYCAAVGGGAMLGQNGVAVCGVGRCGRDANGRIWCSKVPGGSVGTDTNGNIKCFGGCEEASRDLCQEGK